jgi:hypothetical protein
LALGIGLSVASAQEGLWSLELRGQGYVDFEPGNDILLGPELAYSNFNLGSHRLQLRGAYLTSRWESALGQNVINQDYFLFSPLWHFRRNAIFDPTMHVDLGYMRFDRESEKIFASIDNDSYIVMPSLGLNINLGGGAYGFSWHLGYHVIDPESSHIYPLESGLGIWWML